MEVDKLERKVVAPNASPCKRRPLLFVSKRTPTPPRKCLSISSLSRKKKRSTSSEEKTSVSTLKRRRLLSDTDVGERKKRQVKNPKKWRSVEKWGKAIFEKILPMKLPNDLDKSNHTIANLKKCFPHLHAVLDLQNDPWSYSVEGVDVKHVPLRFGTFIFFVSRSF